jgi:AcrR family transcriptional regulator
MTIAGEAPIRASYHHGDLRHALVEAALRLVSEKGVQGFSLRETAREVGVSPAAAYRHFQDKAALLTALGVDGMARLAAAMEEAIARAPGAPGSPARAVAEMAAIGAAYVEFAVAWPAHFRVMFGPWCEHPELGALPPATFPRGRDPYQIMVASLDQLVGTGAIPADVRRGAEVAAWASVHGLASLLVEESLPLGPAERAQALGVIVRTLLAGLGVSPALLGAAGGRVQRAAVSRSLEAILSARRGPPPEVTAAPPVGKRLPRAGASTGGRRGSGRLG